MTPLSSPRKCLSCRETQVLPTVLPSHIEEMEHDGRKYSVALADFRVLKCQNRGELVVDDEADEVLAKALRDAAGLLTPAEIRRSRESLGYTRQQLADSLRISMFTLSRWETGVQILQRAMDAFLRVFFRSAEARSVLGARAREDAAAATPAAAAIGF